LCLLLSLAGCATVILPTYVHDKNPYKKRFYAEYDVVVAATKKAFSDLGWELADQADPALYERAWQLREADVRQVLLMTKYQGTRFGIPPKNTVLNAYIRSGPGATDVELRYLKVARFPFWTSYKYRNDKLIERVSGQIEENLRR
jgi:hypothetical protein